MPRRTPTDLSPHAFRQAVAELGFAYLGGSVDTFVDLKFRKHGRYVDAVRGPRRRMRHQATLDALTAARSKAERERQAIDAARAKQAATAALLAPVAMPRDRASLSDAAAIHQLADDFRVMATRGDGVTFADLMLAGWTAEQINAHGEAARRLGYARENGAVA